MKNAIDLKKTYINIHTLKEEWYGQILKYTNCIKYRIYIVQTIAKLPIALLE